MPNYVYRGTDCQHEFEVYQSFSEDPLTECTECGQPVRRVFHATGLVFKGSGWYVNDSRGGSNAKKTTDSSASTTTAKPAAEASSPATPVAAPAAASD